MNNTQARQSSEQSPSVLFMLEEYKHLAALYRSNEERGEQQATIFITFVALVVTALATRRFYMWISGAAVGAVLLVGTVVLMRLVKRNIQSDEYLRGLGKIRRYFMDSTTELTPYIPYPPQEHGPMRQKLWRDILPLTSIGLVETVQLLNSIAFATFIPQFVVSFRPGTKFRYLALLSLLGFAAAWVAQFMYVKKRYRAVKLDYEKKLGSSE